MLLELIDVGITGANPAQYPTVLQEQRGEAGNTHRTGGREVCRSLFDGASFLPCRKEIGCGDRMTQFLKRPVPLL